jgi:hypothetical protein
MTPKEALLAGVTVLDGVLRPARFVFEFREQSRGSGGNFARGEYVRGSRRLELHFRHSLGLVRYHDGDDNASHEAYMRELGIWEQCRYPGFSEEPIDAFANLSADLRHAEDFLSSDASVLRRAAARERVSEAARHEDLMAGYVGDAASLERMHHHFRARRFREVLSTFDQLKYPRRLSPSDLRMVEIARRKAG